MKHVLLFTILLFTGTLFAQVTYRQFVYFGSGKSTLDTTAQQVLDEMMTEVGSGKILKIELYGHADGSGDTSTNKVLASKRVESVRAYLLSRNVLNSVIVSGAFGEEYRAFEESTPENKGKNRRVEVAITYDP